MLSVYLSIYHTFTLLHVWIIFFLVPFYLLYVGETTSQVHLLFEAYLRIYSYIAIISKKRWSITQFPMVELPKSEERGHFNPLLDRNKEHFILWLFSNLTKWSCCTVVRDFIFNVPLKKIALNTGHFILTICQMLYFLLATNFLSHTWRIVLDCCGAVRPDTSGGNTRKAEIKTDGQRHTTSSQSEVYFFNAVICFYMKTNVCVWS